MLSLRNLSVIVLRKHYYLVFVPFFHKPKGAALLFLSLGSDKQNMTFDKYERF